MHDYFDAPFIYGDERYIQDEYIDERWWYIDEIPGYMISDYGRVWSIKTQSFLKVKSMDAHVWKVLNGQRSHTCGYSFRYLKRNGDRE